MFVLSLELNTTAPRSIARDNVVTSQLGKIAKPHDTGSRNISGTRIRDELKVSGDSSQSAQVPQIAKDVRS
jgi:hypothetical protein